MASAQKWVDLPLMLDWSLDQRQVGPTTFVASGAHQASNVFLGPIRIKQRLVNLLPEKDGERVTLRQREMVKNVGEFFNKSATVTRPRGIFWANTISRLIELWDTTLYVWSANDTYTTVTSMGAESEGPGGITEGIDSSGVAYAYVACESKSVIVKTSGNTTVSDGDYPTDVIPTPVFLDSYIFIPSKSTRKIYNCAVGDPTSWATSTFIETEEFGGNIVALARHHKSVVALCENHIEFFKDAAIAAPNSPLQRMPEYVSRIGCINRATVASIGDTIFFAGRDAFGTTGLFKIEGFKVTKVSNESIDYVLSIIGGDQRVQGLITSWSQSRSNGTNFASCYPILMNGKMYLALVGNAGMVQDVSTTSLLAPFAWLYDPQLQVWVEITQTHRDSGQSTTDARGGWAFPFGTVVNSSDSNLAGIRFLMQNAYGGTADNDLGSLSNSSASGETVNADGGFVSDQSTRATPLIIQWPLIDLGTTDYKVMSGLAFEDQGSITLPVTAVSPLTPLFIRGQYYEVSSATPNYKSWSLTTPFNYTPGGDTERVWTYKTHFGGFMQNWFQLQWPFIPASGYSNVSKVSVLVTPHPSA